MYMKICNSKGLFIVCICLFLTFNIKISVSAEDYFNEIIVDKPLNNTTVSNTINVSGVINGNIGLNKIEISVDDRLFGEAIYMEDNSVFNFLLNTKKLVNGTHTLNITAYDINGISYKKEIRFASNNIFTPIVGQAKITKAQMMKYLLDNNPAKDYGYADNFLSILIDEATAENIRADVAFAQIMKETNFLKFTGTVKENQNNFAGLGATGGGVIGESFPDMQTGIRAVIQHLKAYATVNASLNRKLVDTRFRYVTRGCAEYVEWLGIPDNPFGKGWASAANYGYDIINAINKISAINIVDGRAKLNSLNVSGDYNITATASATSVNKVLYRFWVADRTTGKWEIVQDYSENNTLNWTPTKVGKYTIVVHVKDSLSNEIGEYYEDYLARDVIVEPLKATAIALNVNTALWTGENSQIVASGTSDNRVMYRFWIADRTTGEWRIAQDYSESNILRWTPAKAGKYAIVVHVKDASNTDMGENAYDSYLSKEVEVKSTKAVITQITLDSKAFIYKSKSITVNALSKNKVLYRFWVADRTTGKWEIVQDYSENNTLNWTPTKVGKYTIVVHVKDSLSNEIGEYYEDYAAKDVTVMGTIVLDAGHGGSDPGATGNGYKEATLNMQIVQKLGAKLQNLGFNVLYSRPLGKDVYVSLQDRAKFANDNNADLFISIHHDSSTSSSATGTSTHYSTYRPAIDADGVYVTYNGKKYPFIKEVNGTIYYRDGSTVKTVSINNATPHDSTPSEAGQKSAVLAKELVNALSSLGVSGSRGSSDHNLYVTRWAAMPSVLIEMGFISNKTEITEIANPAYQDKAAQKIADVIYKFFTTQ